MMLSLQIRRYYKDLRRTNALKAVVRLIPKRRGSLHCALSPLKFTK